MAVLEPSPLPLQMSLLRPYWSPAYLPFGKGAAFLRKHLSTTPHALAVTQLKAIKLLVWANLLFAIMDEMDETVMREKKAMNPRIAKYTKKYHK